MFQLKLQTSNLEILTSKCNWNAPSSLLHLNITCTFILTLTGALKNTILTLLEGNSSSERGTDFDT